MYKGTALTELRELSAKCALTQEENTMLKNATEEDYKRFWEFVYKYDRMRRNFLNSRKGRKSNNKKYRPRSKNGRFKEIKRRKIHTSLRSVILSDEDVIKIRTSTLPQKVLAELYGICEKYISAICTGRYYSEVQVESPVVRRKGTMNHMSKLKDEDVLEIRASTLSNGDLGKKYNVSKSAINQIKMGKSWIHLDTTCAKRNNRRGSPGEKNGKVKLKKEEAFDIKYKYKKTSRIKLAKMYNVSISAIAKIRSGITWKDL